jgi:hypothetical protein
VALCMTARTAECLSYCYQTVQCHHSSSVAVQNSCFFLCTHTLDEMVKKLYK